MTHKILLLPGDGIGPEIIAQAEFAIQALNEIFSLGLETERALIGGSAIDASGVPLPENTLSLANHADAILMGAVGGPQWATQAWELRPEQGLLQLRKHFNLFANLRPAILYPELVDASALKPEAVNGLDMMIVRELTGGLYFGEPRGIEVQNGIKYAKNTMIYYEPEIERIARTAFEIALKRNRNVCSVDKANVLEVSELWREVVNRVHRDYSTITLSHLYVDNAVMQLVHRPTQFDVILTENMFGDILSDCAAMLTGSIGMLPSACLNDSGFGLYEPVHGSAPDIAGQNLANPIAALLSLGMLLRYSLHQIEAAQSLENAIRAVLQQGFRTKDIAQGVPEGLAENQCSYILGTREMGEAVIKRLYH